MDAQNISLIIPAYNEEDGIKDIVLKALNLYPDFEIIVIDDGSTDSTYEKIKDLNIKIIRHAFNKGYGASIKAGIRLSSFDLIAIMDADGQHNPQDIKRLIDEKDNYDMVVGARDQKSHKTLWRRPGKKLISVVVNSLSGTTIPDFNSGFRLFKKEIALKFIHLFPNGFSLSTTMMVAFLREGYNVKNIPISVNKRIGKSTVNVLDGFKALILILRLFMIFSPLRIFLPSSLMILLAGSISLLLDFSNQNIHDVTILTLLTGLLIFFLGLIVDQMAHMRREIRQ